MSSHKSTSTTGGDYSNKGLEPSLKEKSGMQCLKWPFYLLTFSLMYVFTDNVTDQIVLTTFKKVEEPVIKEQDVALQKNESIQDNHEEEKMM